MLLLWELFKSFFLANIFGYGGGPASIPLVYHEVIDKHQWMSETDFSNGIALANALPGPIATKIAASVGYPVSGVLGVSVAILATIVPSALLMIIIFKQLDKYKKIKGVARSNATCTTCCSSADVESYLYNGSNGREPIGMVAIWSVSRT